MHQPETSFHDQHQYGVTEWEDLSPTERVNEVLTTLSAMHWQDLQGLTCETIAELAEVHPTTVYVIYRQALEKLKHHASDLQQLLS